MTLQGEREFREAMQRLIRSVRPDKIEPILKRAAAIVTREAKKNAPVRSRQGSNPKPPGVLKKAVKTKMLRRVYGNSSAAPAISAIDRKAAPHAHLVSEGTGERVGKRGKRSYIGKRFGRMPANPFFERAWATKRASVQQYVERQVQRLIEEGNR